jgi:uncharacterized protein (DUF952 family)
MILFHIVEKKQWDESLKNGVYGDFWIKKDGFIHCSTLEQLIDVANNNLKSINERLIVLCIDTNLLKTELRWEKNLKNGITFPHIYGLMDIRAVINTVDIKKNSAGDFYMPDGLKIYSQASNL